MIFISLTGIRATIKGFLLKFRESHRMGKVRYMLLTGGDTKIYVEERIAVIASTGVTVWSKSIPEKRL